MRKFEFSRITINSVRKEIKSLKIGVLVHRKSNKLFLLLHLIFSYLYFALFPCSYCKICQFGGALNKYHKVPLKPASPEVLDPHKYSPSSFLLRGFLHFITHFHAGILLVSRSLHLKNQKYNFTFCPISLILESGDLNRCLIQLAVFCRVR